MANLTGKELVEKGIITGPIGEDNVQQHGVDLNLRIVQRVIGGGVIPLKGKTVLSKRVDVDTIDHQGSPHWYLEPGVYDITFDQGCKIPEDQLLLIRQRSSLLRNGTMLHSSVFDAGFETEQIGTVMHVRVPIMIEVGARIAQIYAHESNIVENLYNGQFQGDKQRTTHK